jgi:hypothetical protein
VLSVDEELAFILSSESQHLNKIKNDISSEFKDKIKKEKLLFFTADDLIEFLDKIKADSLSTESTVSSFLILFRCCLSDERMTT